MIEMMRKIKTICAGRRLFKYLLALSGLALLCYLIYPQRVVIDRGAEYQMTAFLFSRARLDNIEVFKDDSLMHGLKYFHFKASNSDLTRLVQWLDLRQGEAIPEIFVERIKYAKVKSNWKFNWDTRRIYFTYYCHNNSSGWTVDLLLVEEHSAVYMTDGFMPNSVVKAVDYTSCGAAVQR